MNWNQKTKILASLSMLIGNAMVVIGWWIVKENGGNEGPFPIRFGSFIGIMNLVFVWVVFIQPRIMLQRLRPEGPAQSTSQD